MVSKNTICLWYDGTALDAAQFYAQPFPDSAVGAIHRAPGDYPAGKQGDVLTVEFTVIGIPETDRLWNAIVRNGGQESACALVQGQVGPVVADHATGPHPCHRRS